ncbi:hypothetical protein EDB19DRAFT_1834280 [Suillus lakei]|nr:hypothetical protein EDB19DRAFT_1834280 [Suillus lakei]
MDKEEQRISPVKLEWTNREQTELLNKLDSSDGDGIAARDFQIVLFSPDNHRVSDKTTVYGKEVLLIVNKADNMKMTRDASENRASNDGGGVRAGTGAFARIDKSSTADSERDA